MNLLDKFIVWRYMKAGLRFGDAVSYLGIAGKCDGFERRRKRFEKWERRYINRGFVPISLNDFELVGGGYEGDELITDQLFKQAENKCEPVIDAGELFDQRSFTVEEIEEAIKDSLGDVLKSRDANEAYDYLKEDGLEFILNDSFYKIGILDRKHFDALCKEYC